MKAVILAAGVGSRLRPLTDIVPKCMVSVNDITIIDNQISNLLGNNVDDIIVVGGYKSDVLEAFLMQKYPFIKFICNDDYATTNNMYSLYLAMDYLKSEEFLLLNGDVYFDKEIIDGLLKINEDAIACDRSHFFEESMKVTLKDGIINHIDKKITKEDAYSVSIDIYKITKKTSVLLFEIISDFVEVKRDINSWTEVALDKIFDKTQFKPYVIDNHWFEIDNHEDLAKAEIIFKD